MFTEKEKALAENAALLTGSLIAVIPGDAEKKKAYLQLIAEKLATVSDEAIAHSDKPLKAISDNLTNTLYSIHAVLPATEDASKQRAQNRFKSAITLLNGLLDMVGL